MTAAAVLSLPYRRHDERPDDEAGIMQHAIEALIGVYTDALHERASSTAAAILDGLHHFRPDLTLGRLRDAMHDLCRLSAAVVEHEPGTGAEQVARAEYVAALVALTPAVT